MTEISPPAASSSEIWVTQELLAGRVADFSLSQYIVIDATFIERLLLDQRLRDSSRNNGVRIKGATIEGLLDLSATRYSVSLSLNDCRICKSATISRSVFHGSINFTSCIFEGNLDISDTKVNGDLRILDNSVFSGSFLMDSAQIDGNCFLSNCKFLNGLSASLIEVGGTLNIDSTHVSNSPLILRSAAIKGNFSTSAVLIDEELDAAFLQVDGNAAIDQGAKVGNLNLMASNIKGRLVLNSLTVKKGLHADSMSVGSHLFMRSCIIQEQMCNFVSAYIGGNILGDAARFLNGMNAESMSIKGHCFLQNTVFDGMVFSLRNATIDRNLNLFQADFKKGLHFDSLKVNNHLQMEGIKAPKGVEINFSSAAVGGILSLNRAVVECAISGNNLSVGKHILLRNGRFCQIFMNYARVGGNISLGGSHLESIELGGTSIECDLRLSSPEGEAPTWNAPKSISLRNARARAFFDTPDAWPLKDGIIELQGFIYQQIGDASRVSQEPFARRNIDWYAKWLMESKDFGLQPYQQLASVFKSMGYPDQAEEILYSARCREMSHAFKNGKIGKYFGLWLLKTTIGFGLTYRFPLHALSLASFMTCIGAIVLVQSSEAAKHGVAWCLGASLQQLLPVVKINQEFQDFFTDPHRININHIQFIYFMFHSLAGFILSSFVVAAIAGITQARRK